MIVLAHVLIALSSLVFSGYTLISPSRPKLRTSYSLVALTLASGTYLVLSTHAHMLQACFSGLIYVTLILFGLIPARLRLERIESASNR